MKVAYGWEQTARLRRAPFSTPPLVNGKAPAPLAFGVSGNSVRARFSYEPATAELKFTVTGVPRTGLRLVALHRGSANGAGPIVARLVEAGASGGSGIVQLGYADREALTGGRLYLQVHVAGAADDRQRLSLTLPSN
jgi:hypothetical protein